MVWELELCAVLTGIFLSALSSQWVEFTLSGFETRNGVDKR